MCVMEFQPLTCNLGAISAAERPRYSHLKSCVRAAMRDRRELPDGYSYSLDSAKITLSEVSEWITLERLCCPFLALDLHTTGDASRLNMRGPDGSKAILEKEFPAGGHL